MRVEDTEIDGCLVFHLDKYDDERGSFTEIFKDTGYSVILGDCLWRQANCSVSRSNVIRGLHIASYAKLVTCVHGFVTDFVVDLRRDSPSCLKHVSVEMRAEQRKQVFVPAGCGHGFYSHDDGSVVIYMTEGVYAESGEMTLRYDEPEIGVPWPGKGQIVSARDKAGVGLRNIFL